MSKHDRFFDKLERRSRKKRCRRCRRKFAPPPDKYEPDLPPVPTNRESRLRCLAPGSDPRLDGACHGLGP